RTLKTTHAARWGKAHAPTEPAPAARALHSHRLQDHAFRTLSIPLPVEHSLPGTEIQPACGDRNDHLVSDRQRTQVRRRVVLTRARIVAVAVRVPRRDPVLQPLQDVVPEA